MDYRQVHIDFHTSEKIREIGKNFDKKNFQKALLMGHVNSITIFSKCHHGWSYHPTKANQMHPQLTFDLFGAELAAAHEIGVKAVAYLSATLDEKYAQAHRDQLVRNRDGSTTWAPDFETPGYHKICLNTSYLDCLLAETQEVLENYDVDGLFFDITCVQPCFCENCKETLIREGKNPEDYQNVIWLAERVNKNYMDRIRETAEKIRPGIEIFHNGGHLRIGRRDLAEANTHLELESLPTWAWGYDQFPVSAAYARTLSMDYVGMTGKFHTTWGEFGGFKHPNALRYEAALSIANGAACSIGDQMHPNGSLDPATYAMIGAAYQEVEEKEPYLVGAKNIVDIGVLSAEGIKNYYQSQDFSSAVSAEITVQDSGCMKILQEGHFLYNYIDVWEDFSKYSLLILPDMIVCDDFLSEKLLRYVQNGGKVLASGTSATNRVGQFVLDFGCEIDEKNEFTPTYCLPRFPLKSLLPTAHVIYQQSYQLKDVSGTVLADRENPYFNRTAEHFSSHQHAPNDPDSRAPAIVEGVDGIYISWNIFEDFKRNGSIAVKEIVIALIDRLIGEKKSVIVTLPSQGTVTMTQQKNRKIVHLLYASPIKRTDMTSIVEDLPPIYNTEVRVRMMELVKRVYLAPEQRGIPFTQTDKEVSFCVDRFENHQMIVLES